MAIDAATAAAIREVDSMSIDPSEDNFIVEMEGREPICGELWKACAGVNHHCIPKEGEKVFYFPQGHIEQVEPYGSEGDLSMQIIPNLRIPFKIPCLIVNAQFLVEPETDEVYVGYTLIPSRDEANAAIAARNSISTSLQDQACIYTKTLTAADISNTGFPLEKRFADDFLTPMNMSRDPPSQIVVMKDLNGQEWSFLHIYHSELNQHLLTTGWDKFVADKKLVEGDKIVYLRDANGELRIGVHRAVSPHRSNYITTEYFQGAQCAILTCMAHGMAAGTLFTVFYRPWASNSCFLVPYDKNMRAMEEDYPIRARVKMLVGNEEFTGPRFAFGTVIETDPVDPIRWPGSDWRCLKVIWDAPSVMGPLPERVSPWEIELLSPRRSNREGTLVFRVAPNCIMSLVLGIIVLIMLMIYLNVALGDHDK